MFYSSENTFRSLARVDWRNPFLTVSGAGRSKVKVSGLVSSEASLLGMEAHPQCCLSAQKGHQSCWIRAPPVASFKLN